MEIDQLYSDYYDKYETYLNNFIQDFLGGRVITKPPEHLLEVAKKASSLFALAKQGNKEAIPELLHDCYDLHLEALSCLRENELASQSLIIIKHSEKLDRLFKGKNGFFPFLELGSKSWVILDHYLVKKGNTDTCNNPSFVYNSNQVKPLMIYKQKETEKKYPNIPHHEGVHRQVASFLIDKINGGAANVPLSILSTWKQNIGSLQVFKKNQGSLQHFITSDKSINFDRIQEIPTRELQLITVHRTRLYDLDAHLGNLLVKRTKEGELKLIPIDFDYSLPTISRATDIGRVSMDLGWSMFPQMNMPMTQEVKDYVLALDPQKDATILENLDFPSSSILLMKTCTWVWQESARLNLTPGEVVDFLESNIFKSIFTCVKTDETQYHHYLRKHLEERRATTLSNQALIEKVFCELSKDNHDPLILLLWELSDKRESRAIVSILNKLFNEYPFPIIKSVLESFKSGADYSRNIAFALHIPLALQEELKALITTSTTTSYSTSTTTSTASSTKKHSSVIS